MEEGAYMDAKVPAREESCEEEDIISEEEEYPLLEFEPLDQNVRIAKNYRRISVNDLMVENPPKFNTVLYLQLLKIKAGKTQNNKSQFTYGSYNRKLQKNNGEKKYSRIYTFRVLDSSKGQMVNIIESNQVINSNMYWRKSSQYRDNGVVTMGTCIAVYNPLPIVNMLERDSPILETRNAFIVLQKPALLPNIRINENLTQGIARAFVLNGVTLNVHGSVPMATNCGGLFCDKQNVVESQRNDRGCGCFTTLCRRSNIAFLWLLEVVLPCGKTIIELNDFTSFRFDMLFMQEALPNNVTVNSMDCTDEKDLFDVSVQSLVKYFNRKGGFSVIGWYKRGEVNDQSNKDTDEQVDAGAPVYHIVSIYPTNKNPDSEHLYKYKFDVRHVVGSA